MNNTTFTGRLVADPILSTSRTSDKDYCRFTFACDRPISAERKANGDQSVDFLEAIAFGQDAYFLVDQKRKGHSLALNGSLQTRDEKTQAYDINTGQLVAYADGTPVMINRRRYTIVCEHVEGAGIRPADQPRPKANVAVNKNLTSKIEDPFTETVSDEELIGV